MPACVCLLSCSVPNDCGSVACTTVLPARSSLPLLSVAMAVDAASAASPPQNPQLRRLAHLPQDLLQEAPSHPQVGDRIMVLRLPSVDGILDNNKTMLIGAKKTRPGYTWLAAEGQIHGRVKITDSAPLTPEEVKAKQEEHQLPANTKLPKKPHSLMLAEATRLAPPVPYWQPDLALGWHVYRATKNDLPLRSNSSKKRPAGSLQDTSGNNEKKQSTGDSADGATASSTASSDTLAVKLEEDTAVTTQDPEVAAPVAPEG